MGNQLEQAFRFCRMSWYFFEKEVMPFMFSYAKTYVSHSGNVRFPIEKRIFSLRET